MNIILVALGGGAGSAARYLLGLWIKNHTKERAIPTAMLLVNLLGSLGLGLFFGLVYGAIPLITEADWPFMLVGLGFFGAFTTFSTFSVEAAVLLQKRKRGPLAAYLMLSIAGSILMFLAGFTLSG
ncbi:fluoride efflux transporter CrcB [Evansella clarkii]|uniref:fluoride efflux transporter CrcB n=1 Tax=Evansella clarkii TaxID=79879 RepID=UPI000998CC98|nr:fluoride efflux transporter CrcB [Evansella clarkii]